MSFPIEQWFDLTKPISKMDADEAETQMMLYAVKEDIDPGSPGARRQYKAMRTAVKQHNQKFEVK